MLTKQFAQLVECLILTDSTAAMGGFTLHLYCDTWTTLDHEKQE